MATKYLLQCPCGKAHSVDVGQAGRQLTCSCGAPLEVPSMRGIKELPIDESASAASDLGNETGWNSTAGVTFAIGALLMICGIGLGGLGSYYRVKLSVEPPPQEQVDLWVNEIEHGTPEQIYDLWNATIAEGLGDRASSPYILYRDRSRFFGRVATIGFVILGLGLAAIGGAFVLRKR